MTRDDIAGRLTLSTPYYTVEHDMRQGGAIAGLRLTHGRATNLLVRPLATRVEMAEGDEMVDVLDKGAKISHRREGLTEIVTVEARLAGKSEVPPDLRVKTVLEYHWGYIKIRKELSSSGTVPVRAVTPWAAWLAPSLSAYGYREGLTEREGAPPFSFGSNRWGKLRGGDLGSPGVDTAYVPRSVLLANPGVEGLEWFAGSDLQQWDLQLSGKRGQGRFLLRASPEQTGVEFTISSFASTNRTLTLPKVCVFEYYLGIPLLEGHALSPWLHGSFNRNRGEWVAPAEVLRWSDEEIQTVHCHNDGDYYDDGLFWRDGSYPPYPDMDRYDKVIADCQARGIRVATYFSNKELHPSTPEFRDRGLEWGRMNRKGELQHNVYRGTNEFGAQMCLRSGWLEFLKFSIDRVLQKHPLDGVYYDWNVALHCENPRHEGKAAGEVARGHWDIEELLDLMEWTRRRVGPHGLIILHNTTTPMYTMENFADHIVANEWGYGSWKEPGPALEDLPIEWSLVGARSRGVISYGQLNAQSPRRLHRLFALEALLSGVTPWPASPETFELYAMLKPLGAIETWRFLDWRNPAVVLEGARCASAVYSRPNESYVLLGNLQGDSQEVRCVIRPDLLPAPLRSVRSATLFSPAARAAGRVTEGQMVPEVGRLFKEGISMRIPGDSAVLLHLQE